MWKSLTFWSISLALSVLMCGAVTDTQTSASSDTVVYVCGGPKSKRYHKTDKCKGLCRCSVEVGRITLREAERSGYTPCRICYKTNGRLSQATHSKREYKN